MSDLVCISHLRWDFVWQRPQHLLSRLAQYHRVLFVEEPITKTGETTPRLDIQKGRSPTSPITVVRLVQPADTDSWIGHGDSRTQVTYEKLLSAYLQQNGYDSPILWLYTPMASHFADVLPHRALIVDVMDQLSAFKGAPPELIEHEKSVLRRADVVFTGGASLYRAKAPFNPNSHLFPSGVDTAHYAPAAVRSNYPIPAELANLSQPILGYFGVIDERMDLELLAKVAAARPNWNIVLLGPIVKISPEDTPKAPNLIYGGMKDYAELPAYLAHFDVALIPFALNESTEFLSPTKTLEYMAAHKPIVSTPIHDVIELYGDVVRIGRTPEEFIAQVEAALQEPATKRLETENALLARYAWDNIAAEMQQIIAAHAVISR
jgi:glycosyltransferase involved in cell wall biosynthesis